MKVFIFALLFVAAETHAKSITKRVAFVDMGKGIGTGYFIKASNDQCSDPQVKTHFISAAHVGFDIKSPTQAVAKKNTLDFVTNSSAGNPLELFKGLAPIALGMGAAQTGFFTVGQLVNGMNALSYVQAGSEILGYIHYDMNGNNYEMELKSSKDHKTLGLFKRLATLKPSFGTYFRVGMKHFDVSTCHDTIKLDVTNKMDERNDVEYFKLAKAIPVAGEKLSTLGYPGAVGRILMKDCIYEGVQFVGPVKGANTSSLLHTMKCPSIVVPQGLSGGPVLNKDGEVVGTVTRGGVFPKAAPRTIENMLSGYQVAELDRLGQEYNYDYKNDYETVILFSELIQSNVDCQGNIQLGYRGNHTHQTLSSGKIQGKFDENGCLMNH
jgi:hypothetical protein